MARIVPILLVFLAVTGSAIGDVRLVTRRLANGMTIVLAPEVPAEGMAIHVTFDAGSRRDPRGREGTAWMATRVMGSRLENFTADLNQERSVFTATIATVDLRDALGRIARALAGGAVSLPAAPETDAIGEELLLRLVYGERSHGHRAAASPARVRRRDVQRFLDANYQPASAVIAIAGTFDEERVMDDVDATLASLRTSHRQRCTPNIVRGTKERSRQVYGRVQQTEIHIGYPTAVAPEADWYALNVLADILGQGADSRLQRRLVAGGLAKDFGEGETESPCVSSLLRMRARVAANVEPFAVLSAIDEELDRLRRELVSQAELTTAREQERSWAADQMATPAGIANTAARSALFYGDAGRANTDVALMLAVSAEDVRRVAQKYLQPSNRAVVIVRPAS